MLGHIEGVGGLRQLACACAGVAAGEDCLIVSDSRADQSIVEMLGTVLRALGASVIIAAGDPVQLPGDEPPRAVSAAMAGADVIFEATSNFAGSSQARRDACARGARYLTVPGLTWESLRPDGPCFADFRALGEHARRLAQRFDAAEDFHLTSAAGTDLRGSFAGRAGRPLWGVADEPGGYAAPPDIEVGAAPLEGSAEGVVIIDGSVLFLGPNQLPSPIRLRFRSGLLDDADGADAWRLLDAVDGSGDARMRNLAELSIGLNPNSRPGGSPLELEGIVGGAHVAVGNNIPYGGSVDARAHIDCVMLAAELRLDGEIVDPVLRGPL